MIGLDDLLLLLSEAAIISLGTMIIYVSLRAHRKTGIKSMLVISLGFAIIILGSLTEEIIVELLHYPLIRAHTIENSIVAVGLLFIVYSIYGARD